MEDSRFGMIDRLPAIIVSNLALSAVLAVLVYAMTKWCRNPALSHALWLLVLVKLVTPPLIPLSLPTFASESGDEPATLANRPVPLQAAPAAAPAAEPEIAADREQTGGNTSSESPQLEVGSSLARQLSQPTVTGLPLWRWILILSALGTFCLVFLALSRHLRLLRIIKTARDAEAALAKDARELAQKIGLSSCPPVKVTNELICPLVAMGIRRRIILLSAPLLVELDPEQTRTVLAHELAHIRRHDDWIRCFELAVLALFWWNPVAWYASNRLRRAEEECCDAFVIWALPASRRHYGEALLRTVERLTESRSLVAVVGTGFGGHVFSKRIEAIMKKDTRHRMSSLGWALLLVLAITVLPLAAQTGSRENSKPPGIDTTSAHATQPRGQESQDPKSEDSVETAGPGRGRENTSEILQQADDLTFHAAIRRIANARSRIHSYDLTITAKVVSTQRSQRLSNGEVRRIERIPTGFVLHMVYQQEPSRLVVARQNRYKVQASGESLTREWKVFGRELTQEDLSGAHNIDMGRYFGSRPEFFDPLGLGLNFPGEFRLGDPWQSTIANYLKWKDDYTAQESTEGSVQFTNELFSFVIDTKRDHWPVRMSRFDEQKAHLIETELALAKVFGHWLPSTATVVLPGEATFLQFDWHSVNKPTAEARFTPDDVMRRYGLSE